MSTLRFDGRVVVVTGAGAGLGRAYALLFASRGAKVVVNDLGGGRHGDGSSSKAADGVVNEIRALGGVAVADYNSVTDGEKLIQTALDNFGRIDVLVNNAGILRDKSFARISDQDWDLVLAVHLKGSFKTTQAAFPVFKKQGYGRVIMTSSNSGVYGNFGQANYSAAKLGVVGLSNTVAIEGAKYNIHCNVIVPTAASRLTEDILPPDMFAELKPEFIAPVVAYLCHESCQENGVIIDSAAGWAGKVHMVRSPGSLLRTSIGSGVTPEDVRDNWDKVTDMSQAKKLKTITEASAGLMTALEKLKTLSNNAGNNQVTDTFEFTNKDLILYALGIGASVSNTTDLKYLYESHEDFGPLPTFFVLPSMIATMSSSLVAGALPNHQVDFGNILHGEQYLEIVADMPTSGLLETTCTVVDVLDKRSGALVIVAGESYDSTGSLIVKSQSSVFVVGAGGFGGPRLSEEAIACTDPPKRKPDSSQQQVTTVNQAALYRLSGDLNPLHIDPTMAAVAGFKKPILHGLCTLGYSVRAVLNQYAGNNPSLFKAVKVRFTNPVLPGNTLRVDMWREKNRIHFKTYVVETGAAVITGAFVDLKQVTMPVSTNSTSAKGLQSDAVFEKIRDGVATQPEKAKSVNAVFLYNITDNGKQVKQWTLDLKSLKVYEGPPKDVKADTTLTVSDVDMLDIALGKLNPQLAFMKGKLKIAGNVMLTQKLLPLLKTDSKL